MNTLDSRPGIGQIFEKCVQKFTLVIYFRRIQIPFGWRDFPGSTAMVEPVNGFGYRIDIVYGLLPVFSP
jgi:hypothetical protein